MAKPSNKFGCRLKDGKITVGRNLNIEIQALLHTSKVETCLIVFVNSSNHADTMQTMVKYDDEFFHKNVSTKLSEFFKLFLSKKVFENATHIKK